MSKPTFQALEAIEELFNHPGLLGFQSLAHDIQVAHRNTHGYPPRNIIRTGDDSWVIEVAVAGFRPEELGVEMIGNRLNITGTSTPPPEADEGVNYIHQGLARRNFVFTIRLGDHVKVDESLPPRVENGLLLVSLVREIPEAAKPKQYAITQA